MYCQIKESVILYNYKNKREKQTTKTLKKKYRTDILRIGGTIHWKNRELILNMRVVIPSNSSKKTLSKYENKIYRKKDKSK